MSLPRHRSADPMASVLPAPVYPRAPPRTAGHLLARNPPHAHDPRAREAARHMLGSYRHDNVYEPQRADLGDE
jgi:hypothetical protein